jgi:trimethylamine--corrinoid protein Co-methyltransferase
VALGAVETGLITAASVQLAKSYGLPCRSVGSVTEAKREDYQAGFERFATLLPAVLGGVDYITCAGTLDSSMLESDALLVLDDEVCGAGMRMARGIEVNEMTLAMEIIRKVGFSGNYITEKHTMQNYRTEHFLPQLMVREPYEAWEKAGARSAIDNARDRARQMLADHKPVVLDAAIEKELEGHRRMVADRPMEDFYKYEAPELQDLFLEH